MDQTRFSGNVKSLLATWAKWTEKDGRATGDGAPAAPNLKIIHLIRDPLAVARSTVKFTRQGRWDGLTAVNEVRHIPVLKYRVIVGCVRPMRVPSRVT